MPVCIPRVILIHSTVWPQYTNVTDRTDRQRSDSIRRTVLQTVTRKLETVLPELLCVRRVYVRAYVCV